MLDAALAEQDIAGIALAGLTAWPKTLPPKLFYDAEGVRLFEAITRLPEYYVSRTECALLARIAPEIAELAEPGAALVEYGASDEGKAELLLASPCAAFASYVPIDVASGALDAMKARLRVARPSLRVHPLCIDFLRPIMLPNSLAKAPKFGFFPGSTIGNLEPAAACDFLAQARGTLGEGAWLIVGVDLRKPARVLVPAYDDAAGVTAAFNLNLLRRLNREAAANFALDSFSHRALWNDAEGRIEMHLVSRKAQTVRLAGMHIDFAEGETIHTENSYKHSVAGFRRLAAAAGWSAEKLWMDEAGLFSIHGLRA
jgi:dimethylhistidine N-methyltransferase